MVPFLIDHQIKSTDFFATEMEMDASTLQWNSTLAEHSLWAHVMEHTPPISNQGMVRTDLWRGKFL